MARRARDRQVQDPFGAGGAYGNGLRDTGRTPQAEMVGTLSNLEASHRNIVVQINNLRQKLRMEPFNPCPKQEEIIKPAALAAEEGVNPLVMADVDQVLEWLAELPGLSRAKLNSVSKHLRNAKADS